MTPLAPKSWQNTKEIKSKPRAVCLPPTPTTPMIPNAQGKRVRDDREGGGGGGGASGAGGGGGGLARLAAIAKEEKEVKVALAKAKEVGRALVAELHKLGITPACTQAQMSEMMEGVEDSGARAGPAPREGPPAKKFAAVNARGSGAEKPMPQAQEVAWGGRGGGNGSGNLLRGSMPQGGPRGGPQTPAPSWQSHPEQTTAHASPQGGVAAEASGIGPAPRTEAQNAKRAKKNAKRREARRELGLRRRKPRGPPRPADAGTGDTPAEKSVDTAPTEIIVGRHGGQQELSQKGAGVAQMQASETTAAFPVPLGMPGTEMVVKDEVLGEEAETVADRGQKKEEEEQEEQKEEDEEDKKGVLGELEEPAENEAQVDGKGSGGVAVDEVVAPSYEHGIKLENI
ncbi:uncharacterized protein RCC_01138 [Ramularia collo-cygni]|uniref:Uncharacterized protein n=1 Tax=Ramularia collo-cygni TaxID=112498 RepID=A0A2D3UYN4_9PEZI|nr:uncharacterized protein RCC_01138 [Ramularia collo-cygni]CZT15274.1 uncharacterized protein RCC_01138 [Ramularia collo-cygni]